MSPAKEVIQLREDFGRMLGTVRALLNSADIAVLLVSDAGIFCGVAARINSIPAEDNYALVAKARRYIKEIAKLPNDSVISLTFENILLSADPVKAIII